MWNKYFAELNALFHNYVFLSAIVSWGICQLTKSVIAFVNSPDEKKFSNFVAKFGSTGGMPSSHSSVVISLCISVGLKVGFDSEIFILAFILATIIIRDAVGVRYSNGIQAKTLNSLGKKVSKKLDIAFSPVREVNGHTPSEVLVGSLIGAAITLFLAMYLG